MNIHYIDGNEELLPYMKPLWEKTKDYHSEISTHFSEKFSSLNFESKKQILTEKTIDGRIKIILAKDKDTNIFIGYCVAIIDNKNIGEIESIFVKQDYRRNGIARNLMNKALRWMDENSVKGKKLLVAVGNEDVLKFYKSFGFYSYQILLEYK